MRHRELFCYHDSLESTTTIKRIGCGFVDSALSAVSLLCERSALEARSQNNPRSLCQKVNAKMYNLAITK